VGKPAFSNFKSIAAYFASALQLYFTGKSLRNVQKFLKLQGVNFNHNTVYRWVKKYVGLKQLYLEKITPNVSDA
jgi:putative transposase